MTPKGTLGSVARNGRWGLKIIAGFSFRSVGGEIQKSATFAVITNPLSKDGPFVLIEGPYQAATANLMKVHTNLQLYSG